MLLECSVLLIGAICIQEISGHGMMLEPPNRSSLWRFPDQFPGAIPNYNDNENFCGGMSVQWNTFGGNCGVCGDRYDKPHPQDNENTGKYGKMGIARTYKAGDVIDVQIRLTTNHLGYFKYSICVLEDPNAPETGEECFKQVTLDDGNVHYNVSSEEKTINNKVKLPDGFTCDRCVFRWHYNAGGSIMMWAGVRSQARTDIIVKIELQPMKAESKNVPYVSIHAGNNWGKCDDGTSKEGCGPQETFRSCADIKIEA